MRACKATPRADLHAQITESILSAIEDNSGEWRMPWRQEALQLPHNALTKNAYNGINILSLWAQAKKRGFPLSLWASYKQWQELGAQVRRGEKSSHVMFYKAIEVEPNAEDETDDGKRLVAKSFAVFNVAQVDDYALPPEPDALPPVARMAAVDRFIESTQARIIEAGDRAYYDRINDHIVIPDDHRFIGTATMDRREAYYSVKLHELSHWTGHETRLNRTFGKRFGDQAYAAEELVAELATAFLSAELGISQTTPPDHAHYLGKWLQLLKSDNRAIFTAAAKASEAATFLKSLQAPGPERPPLRTAVGNDPPHN
jgi:antirestriction protein ArdC